MFRRLAPLLFSLIITHSAICQQLPREESSLNYRIIGFSAPGMADTGSYILQTAVGRYNTEKDFDLHIIKTLSGNKNRLIAEVPFWGRDYTWRMVYKKAGTVVKKSNLFHFHTMANDEIDPCTSRFRVLTPAGRKYKDHYVFLDSYRALYDMKGQPVWFLPPIGNKNVASRDLKVTSAGTITFMMGENIYEVNYDGVVKWKGPGGFGPTNDTDMHFHHQFSRLSNGHYMTLGIEKLWQKRPTAQDSSLKLIPHNKFAPQTVDTNYYRGTFFGTVLEFDQAGKLVWSWKSSDYFNQSDLRFHKTPDNNINTNTHENAFFFDEKNGFIYVSFKAISRVVKITYPEGNVVNIYGELFQKGQPVRQNPLFCEQHSCMVSKKGHLYLYDNNFCNPGTTSKIVVLQQPVSPKDPLKKIWEYTCTVERTKENKNAVYQFPSGGNVYELPDGSMFACMGGTYSKVFIVSPDKKELWSALPESWNDDEKKWEISSQYRASIITADELAQMIWNADAK